MQKFLLNFAVVALALSTVFLTSCSEDEDPGPGTGNDLPPLVNFESGFLTGDADLQVGESFTVKVAAQIGDAPLKTLTIQEGGVNIPITGGRFSILKADGTTDTNNPLAIIGDLKNGTDWEITINPDASEEVGTFKEYTFIVDDENNQSDQVSLTITRVAPPGTPISMSIGGVLLNQAGPAGTGGLDLDAGLGTGSADMTAEIRDLGIDCTINQETGENWRAQFGSLNGAVMVKVDKAQIENFDFDNIDTKEAIQGAFDTGISLNDGVSMAPDCTETAVTNVSGEITVEDAFVVFANDTYYLLRVDEINAIHTPDVPVDERNSDNIVLSIKY